MFITNVREYSNDAGIYNPAKKLNSFTEIFVVLIIQEGFVVTLVKSIAI